MTVNLTEPERVLLNEILDQIVPANPDRNIPGAGQLGVAEFLSTHAAEDSTFASHVTKLLTCAAKLAGDAPPDFARQWEIDEPEAFAALLRQTYMGYYSRSDVRSLLGLSGQPTQPNGYDVPLEAPEFMAELVAPVVGRGPIYRAG